MNATTGVLRAAAALLLGGVVGIGPSAAAAVAPDPVPVQLGGAPIRSSTDPASPTLLTAGVWADQLGAATSPEGRHEFAYKRTIADSTIHVGVVGTPGDTDGGETLHIEAAAPGGVACGSEDSIASYPVTQRLLGVGLAIGSSELGVRDSGCLTADEVTFSVDRGSSASESDLPIAVRVIEEAPVEDTATDLPSAPESPTIEVPETTAPVAGAGTASFDDAPRLTAATTYDDTIAQGATLLYRVRVGWGQTLAVRLDLPSQDLTGDAADGAVEPEVQLTLLDPMRAVLDGEVEQSVSTGDYLADEATRLVEGTAPIGYLNRFDGVAGTVPGDYWIAVAAERAADDTEPVDVPFTLVADVTGPIAGVPTYPATVQSPGGGAGPTGYAAAAPYLLADGVFAADVPGDATGSDSMPADATGRDRVRLTVGILLGAASLGCCAAGVALIRRRPRPEPFL